jgi:homoserine dehydrogenase
LELTIGVGVLGCGTVGAAVADRLARERSTIEARSGVRYHLRGVAIRDELKPRPASLASRLFTRNAQTVVDDAGVDLVIELMGGIGEAAELVERALERGRHVVTANKDLLATQGPRLAAIAALRGVSLRFEGAVAGAVPIARVLGESLAGDCVESVAGLLSGTCTFVLSAMEAGATYAQALAAAQAAGYAEADPAGDVSGLDAAHKLALLAQLAFGQAVITPRIRYAGIGEVSRDEVVAARRLGRRIRLVAAVARTRAGLSAEVAPVLVAEDHPFARTSGVENVVRIAARDAGTLELRGAGAGGAATACAILGDVVTALRAIAEGPEDSRRRIRPALTPVLDVCPFLAGLARISELPQYPLWDDRILEAPAAQRDVAFSWPGKDLCS